MRLLLPVLGPIAWAAAAGVSAATPDYALPAPAFPARLTPAPDVAAAGLAPAATGGEPVSGTLVTDEDRKSRAVQYLKWAQSEEAQGHREKAVDYLTCALDLSPGDYRGAMEQARMARAALRLQLHDLPGALDDYHLLAANDPTNAQILAARGAALVAARDYQGALDDFDQLSAADPESSASYNGRGQVKLLQGDVAGALAEFDAAIAAGHGDAGLYYGRAYVWRKEHRPANERADLEKAAQLNPRFAPAFGELGWLSLKEGDSAGAVSFLDRAVALQPNLATFHLERASALATLGRFGEARSEYIAAINAPLRGDTNEDYLRIALWVAEQRGGAPRHSAAALAKVLESKDEWTRAIAQFFTGELSADQFKQAADRIPAKDPAGRRCERAYYLGIAALLDRDADSARGELRDCLASGASDFQEYIQASAELARLSPGGAN